jgi:hypothetical protein
MFSLEQSFSLFADALSKKVSDEPAIATVIYDTGRCDLRHSLSSWFSAGELPPGCVFRKPSARGKSGRLGE